MPHLAQKFLSRLTAVIAMLVSTGNAHAQLAGRPIPQDNSHAIESMDILGVRLGMPEADASAAVISRLEGTSDSAGNKIHLRRFDYTLQSPVTHAPVRAGVRFERDSGTPGVGDAVRLLTFEGRVWGIWRNDVRGHYAYDAMLSDLTKKYAAAAPILGLSDRINNGQRENGGAATSGVELYSGHCTSPPLFAGYSDTIRLEPGCDKVFWIKYGVIEIAGVRSMNAGTGQLVDVDVGRRAFDSMKGVAAKQAQDANQRGGAAKL